MLKAAHIIAEPLAAAPAILRKLCGDFNCFARSRGTEGYHVILPRQSMLARDSSIFYRREKCVANASVSRQCCRAYTNVLCQAGHLCLDTFARLITLASSADQPHPITT